MSFVRIALDVPLDRLFDYRCDDATQADERRARREALSHHQQEVQLQRRDQGEGGGNSDAAGGEAGSGRHINLFEAEEKVDRARMNEHERWRMQEDAAPIAGAPPPPPPPTNRESGRTRGPFYLQENPYTSTSATVQQRSEAFVAREERRKAELDPMAAYSTSDKRRRTDGAAGVSIENPRTSTALVVRPRTSRREKDPGSSFDQGEVASTSSESESDKRHRKKGKKRKRKKKHRRSSEEREKRRRTSEKK